MSQITTRLLAWTAVCAMAVASSAFADFRDNPRFRIMPLGDSITEGAGSAQGGGYRTPLYQQLTALDYNVDLVGANTANPSQILIDAGETHHQGHGGWRISHPTIGLYEHLVGWAPSIETPHVILVHVGTNDTNDGDYEHAINRYDKMIDRLLELYPNAYVVATTLLERGDNTSLNDKIHAYFNPFVEQLVADQVAKGHTRVCFLDMNSKLTLDDMPADRLHPDDSGYAKMASAWTAKIQEIFPDPTAIETPPAAFLSVAAADSRKKITVVYNESVQKSSAETPANYALAGTTAQIVSAELAGDNRTLFLLLDKAIEEDAPEVTLTATGVLSADGKTASTATKAVTVDVPRGAYRNVPAAEVGRYQKVYAIDLPSRGAVYQNEHLPYAEDYHFTTPKFSRVAYYLELRKPGEQLEYVWVSMDAFTDDPWKIGIPTVGTGARFQQYVTNLKVYSNTDKVRTGDIAQGNIEFWPSNYDGANAANIPNADGGTFDFGDRMTNGDYGSMQVHDYENRTTIFAYNRWGGGGRNYQQGLGIGSYTGANGYPDWTHVENSESYDIRRLEVYVMPDETDATPPQVVKAELGLGRKTVTVTFDKPVSEAGLDTAFQVGDYGVVSAKRLPRSRTDNRATRVYLTLASIVPETDTAVQLTVGGVRDTSPRANAVPAGTTAAITQGGAGLPSELGTTVNAALSQGYKLLYTVDVPVNSDWVSKQDALYTVNEYSPAIGPFDRVAYYYELDKEREGSAYAWVSMDAWSQDARQLGIPSARQQILPGGFFVYNLQVASNGGAAAADGADGFMEVWPYNYDWPKQTLVPGQLADTFSMGDQLNFDGDYGCFQVHNVTAAQTVFAINHFGRDGFHIATGIGPSQKDNGANSTDWTFRENAVNFVARRLHVLVRPCAKVEFDDGDVAVPPEVSELVADAVDYKLLYKIDLPATGASFGDANVRRSYYAKDNRAKLPANIARVAYMFKLTDNAGTKWAWTAFDPPSSDFAQLDVPFNSKLQRKVKNMDVLSNVEGIVTGRGIETGNIEFGSGNYTESTQLGVGDGGIYDCDDSLQTGSGHGTMQVHNYGEHQMVWGFNHFNNNSVPGVFIGNETSNNRATDGTFTYNAGDYTARELYVMVKYADAEAPEEVVRRVPDAANYQLLYKINVPDHATFNDATFRAANYLVDNSGRLDSRPVRVAYMLDLDGQWVWTSFKSLAKTTARLGVPFTAIVQGKVEDMDVYTNVEGLPTGTGLQTGCIEFCSGNYAQGTQMGVGDGAIFDVDDTLQASRGGHGCMQVHDWGTKTTLWAINHFNNGNAVGIGIGNDPAQKSGATDWTFQENAGQYTTRTLYVLVSYDGVADTYDETAAQGDGKKINHVVVSKDGTRVAVRFADTVTSLDATPSRFALEGATIAAAEVSPIDARDVLLTLREPLATGFHTLTYTVGTAVQTKGAERVDATPSAVLAGVAEAADYELVYRYQIPTQVSAHNDFAYEVDQSRFEQIPFDRVAYLLELTGMDSNSWWVWTSMDALDGAGLADIAIPTPRRPKTTHQCYVEDLHVYGGSSAEGVVPVKTGEFPQGNIEFWPNTYNEGNAAGIPGASDGCYDWGDTMTSGSYGSMQVHNYLNRETCFSFSHFYNGGEGLIKPSLGIGNDAPDSGHNGSTDWTFRENAEAYAVRTLSIFVRRSAGSNQGCGPVFTVQPQDARMQIGGEPATLTAFAPGAAFYQWRVNGQPLAGETGAVLTVAPEKAGAYVYDVVAFRDAANCTVSDPATVRVVGRALTILVR